MKISNNNNNNKLCMKMRDQRNIHGGMQCHFGAICFMATWCAASPCITAGLISS